jgi:hypothetical protein
MPIVVIGRRPARASDAFEIQVYDATANAPGVPEIELHLNRFAPGCYSSDPPELPLHGQAHATFERYLVRAGCRTSRSA